MYLAGCPLHGPGSIASRGGVFQGIFPRLIILRQRVLSQGGRKWLNLSSTCWCWGGRLKFSHRSNRSKCLAHRILPIGNCLSGFIINFRKIKPAEMSWLHLLQELVLHTFPHTHHIRFTEALLQGMIEGTAISYCAVLWWVTSPKVMGIRRFHHWNHSALCGLTRPLTISKTLSCSPSSLIMQPIRSTL